MPSVLVVDDEAPTREGMVSIFVEQGFAPVYAAENGGEALSILREKVVDGMILDIRMPGLSGIDILCSMREQNLAEPLIFILSGYDDFAYAQAAIPYGVAEYILKPLVPERAVEFCRKMKALIEDRKRMREEHTFLERSVREKEWAVRKRDIERILAGRDSEGFSAVLSGYGFLPPYDRSYALLAARIDDSSGGAFFLGLGEELSAAFPRSIRGKSKLFHAVFFPAQEDCKEFSLILCLLGFQETDRIPGPHILEWLEGRCRGTGLLSRWHMSELPRVSDTGRVLRQMLFGMEGGRAKGNYLVMRIAECIDTHLFEELTSRELSRVFRYSGNYIGQIFKSEFGCSLNEFINRKRIERAQQNLKRENLTVSEVAYLVGYKDIHYFCTLFKKITGLTPKQFRSLSVQAADRRAVSEN
jgi:two-component system response regulator YesN